MKNEDWLAHLGRVGELLDQKDAVKWTLKQKANELAGMEARLL